MPFNGGSGGGVGERGQQAIRRRRRRRRHLMTRRRPCLHHRSERQRVGDFNGPQRSHTQLRGASWASALLNCRYRSVGRRLGGLQ